MVAGDPADVRAVAVGGGLAAEGAGVDWPGGDVSLPVVLAFVVLLSLGYVSALRRRRLALA